MDLHVQLVSPNGTIHRASDPNPIASDLELGLVMRTPFPEKNHAELQNCLHRAWARYPVTMWADSCFVEMVLCNRDDLCYVERPPHLDDKQLIDLMRKCPFRFGKLYLELSDEARNNAELAELFLRHSYDCAQDRYCHLPKELRGSPRHGDFYRWQRQAFDHVWAKLPEVLQRKASLRSLALQFDPELELDVESGKRTYEGEVLRRGAKRRAEF